MADKLLEVKGLKKYFDAKGKGKLHAVDDISFHIYKGETLGLVGESGCGKSTVGNLLLRLQPATAGSVFLDDIDILNAPRSMNKKICRKIQMVFQDPYSSLNPKKSVKEILEEPFIVQKIASGPKDLNEKISKLCELVNINKDILSKYPHELDGGKRQTICLARSLAFRSDIIVCDEPVSSLDVSIQAQIINMLMDLQDKLHTAYLFISHDLSVVRHISNRIIVMYLGRIMEESPTENLFKNPLHPYTQALLSAIPSINLEDKQERIILKGDVPSPIDPPNGCRFYNRCRMAKKICKEIEPQLVETGVKDHRVACHLWKES